MTTIPATDLSKLAAELSGITYQAALPSELSDRWLHPLVRDLRQIECMMNGDETATPHMSGPLFLVMRLLTGRMEERGIDGPGEFDEERLANWFRVYQILLERELVSRTLGLASPSGEGPMLLALDEYIDEIATHS